MPSVHLVPDIEFDSRSGELRRASGVTRLEPQPAVVLRILASQPGTLVTHDELRREVWGDQTFVKLPDALHYCVREIRAALGDSPREPRYIETVPRRGYRLRADAVRQDTPKLTTRRNAAARRWAWRLAMAAAVVAAIAIFDRRPNTHHDTAVAVLKSLHDLVY